MKKVIIAGDLKTTLEKDHSFFNRSDIRAIAAATNEDILDLHRAEKANLIITYLDMPGMNGENLCALIRDDVELRNVSIIIVCPETAVNLQRCVQCGANAFITTPVNNAVLLQEAYQLLHVTPRKSCRIPLKLKIEGASKEKPFTGHVENISASGMLFQSSAILFEGDTIKCSFSLPDSTRITASAEIVRVMQKENENDADTLYGVRFPDLSEADASALEVFVKSNTKTYSVQC
jgi:CheY-like chemotaxis protein